MVDKLEIITEENFILFDNKLKKIIINDQEKDFKEDIFNKLLNIICLWTNNYINNNTLDGTEYKINIYSNNLKEEIIIKNDFPFNFIEFLKVLGEVYE